MSLNLHTQQYVEWKVYNVTTIKNKLKTIHFSMKTIFVVSIMGDPGADVITGPILKNYYRIMICRMCVGMI